ncbi:MAG: DUF302 domain-containing protein [Thermoprotei archaeon]
MEYRTAAHYSVTSSQNVETVLQSLTSKLAERGFGVLSQIDVQKVLKEKTGANIGPYTILEVCKPAYAKKALEKQRSVGLALPCKIVVYQEAAKSVVSLYRPTQAVSHVGVEGVEEIAESAERELKEAVDTVSDVQKNE